MFLLAVWTRPVAKESKRVSELTTEDASSTFAATLPLESLKDVFSRCMTGMRGALAEEKVLGFYDISRAHFHSPARRTIVIKVPREDGVKKSGYAVLDKAMYGTQDAAQCFDVASENAMTAMGYDTWQVFAFFCIIRALLTCRCSDTVTILWCRAREHNKRSSRNNSPSISSSSILPHWDHAQHWKTSRKSGY